MLPSNAVALSLGEGETRVVRFLFKAPANGSANLGFTVAIGGWITGALFPLQCWIGLLYGWGRVLVSYVGSPACLL